jgi:hypothetical protein
MRYGNTANDRVAVQDLSRKMVLNCSALSGKKPGSIREKVRKIKLKELCRFRTVEGHMWEIAGRLRADPGSSADDSRRKFRPLCDRHAQLGPASGSSLAYDPLPGELGSSE